MSTDDKSGWASWVGQTCGNQHGSSSTNIK